MWIDAYAMAYGLALLLTALIAAVSRQPDRMMGAGLLALAWVYTLAIQNAINALTAPAALALFDVGLFFLFGVIALWYRRDWAYMVAGLHVFMLIFHFLYAQNAWPWPRLYLEFLALLGYASMALVAIPPAFGLIGLRNGQPYHVCGDGRRNRGFSALQSAPEQTREEA